MQALNTANLSSADTGRARLIERLGGKNPLDPIPRRHEAGPAPLSFPQERLWIMSQLEPDNPIYNVAGAARFDGALRVDILEQALAEVARRHEILRSRFVTVDAEPRQQVLPEAELAWERLDLSALPEHEKKPAFERHADAFIRRPFRLAEQPPLRVLLAVMAPQRHILLPAFHHMVSDRWSVGVLMREVAALYGAFCHGAPSPLPALPLQYADYCVWQRSRQAKWDSQLAYWQSKLAGAPPLLELPTDRPRPPQQSYRGDVHCFELSAELSLALKQLAKRHNATLFMVMAAAFSTLLYRYSGSRDFCIGYPVAGRGRSQLTDLIGFFVNTLVLRCRIDGKMRFSDWLAQIRDQALQDQNHQEPAFGQLLEALNPPRNPSHAPVFQVMLTLQNAPAGTLKLPGIETMLMPVNTYLAPYDLALLLEESAGTIHGTLEYCSDLFDASTVSRMAGHLQTVLAEIARQPFSTLGRVPLLSASEKQQLLGEWSGKPVDYPQHSFVHRLFAERTADQPDKPALACAGHILNYRELNERAERWALALRRRGIGPECRVGVCLERSFELIVALLAVMKSGAAYVPLDPDYPEERLDFMIADSGIELLLTQSGLVGKLQLSDLAVLCLDRFPDACGDRDFNSASTGCRELAAGNTAYIIYTSGSTGHPKGVAVSHRNLLYSTLARSRYYREPFNGFLLLSSFAFDSSVAGIFWTLTQGACLCLPRQGEIGDPRALARLVERYGISHVLALPSFYAAIVEAAGPTELHSLKTVIVAGEACPGEVAALHRRLLPSAALYNEYGPTEGTVWSSVYRVADGDIAPVLPIGRPIDNVRIYLVDALLQPVPVGVAGELYVGGAGVAQGYLHRPELTAERFVPDPFGGDGERLYRTGDLARFRWDGDIEFLGRVDQQVKIRGYRIEPGEIEERLRRHPAIKEAAVLAKDESGGNKKLVAYVVAQTAVEVPENAALRDYLKQTLPDYMVPAHYVRLEALPYTPNGKCDRRALAAMGDVEQASEAVKLPGNWLEESLAAIWKDVLNTEKVGIDANFFDMGGHSLAAIQVGSRIQQQFAIELPLDVLFESPTVESLAAAVVELLEAQHGKEAIDALLSELG